MHPARPAHLGSQRPDPELSDRAFRRVNWDRRGAAFLDRPADPGPLPIVPDTGVPTNQVLDELRIALCPVHTEPLPRTVPGRRSDAEVAAPWRSAQGEITRVLSRLPRPVGENRPQRALQSRA